MLSIVDVKEQGYKTETVDKEQLTNLELMANRLFDSIIKDEDGKVGEFVPEGYLPAGSVMFVPSDEDISGLAIAESLLGTLNTSYKNNQVDVALNKAVIKGFDTDDGIFYILSTLVKK